MAGDHASGNTLLLMKGKFDVVVVVYAAGENITEK